MAKRLSIADYKNGILEGNRMILARGITLVESKLPRDQELAEELLTEILPFTGNCLRMGVSGVPGVGKSTFIDAFGTYVIQRDNTKMAVLAVDPSSSLSKGSVLGDKTRMNRLSVNPSAFIRPTASSGSLGGVAQRTRETALLCEAAGYQWILIETVGVGQSETMVRGMVDFFLLLMLSGAGDELQGMKRGIMEICDALFINKADGENEPAARRAAAEYASALHLYRPHESDWVARVGTISSLEEKGMDEVYKALTDYRDHTTRNGFFAQQRQSQNEGWLVQLMEQELLGDFHRFRSESTEWQRVLELLRKGEIPVRKALRVAMDAMKN